MEKLNGVVETHQLQSRETYKDGKLDGLREVWYANGQLKSRETYKDGKRDGLRERWNDNGELVESATYKDGVVVE